MTLVPLLSDAESLAPELPRGIPAAALRRLSAPRAPAMPSGELGDRGAAPDDLRAQRWGLCVPEGQAARAGWVAELVAHRRAQQGGVEPRVYQAPPALGAWAAVQWISTSRRSSVGMAPMSATVALKPRAWRRQAGGRMG